MIQIDGLPFYLTAWWARKGALCQSMGRGTNDLIQSDIQETLNDMDEPKDEANRCAPWISPDPTASSSIRAWSKP